MNLLQSIHELPRLEKIKVMEYLWEELSVEDKKIESPEWHQKVLSDTENRVSDGKEKVINWSEAKQRLRKEFK